VFQYQDIDDYTVTAQEFGEGDGTTTDFQLVRTLGGFDEEVLAPIGTPSIYLDGVNVPIGGFLAPSGPALSSVTSGALAGTTYYVKAAWVTKAGNTHASAETSLVVATNHVVKVTAPTSPPGTAIGWNVFVADDSTGTGTETSQNATMLTIGVDWQEPDTGLVVGANPASNTTDWSLLDGGIVSFDGAPIGGVILTWTGTYNWLCRFIDTTLDFANFAYRYWALGKIQFRTIHL
jgi:hypothetical protein